MKKPRGQSLDDLLKKKLGDQELQIMFEERRFYLRVAHLIRDLRAKSGLSQSELAEGAGVSQPLIARLERGDQQRTPTFETLHKVLRALGYSMVLSVRPEKKAA